MYEVCAEPPPVCYGRLINNGLAPPNPANVIDHDIYMGQDVYVRNAGCPPFGAINPDDPCPSPGAVTEVGVVSGGSVEALRSYDSSTIEMSGGGVHRLWAYDSSTITIVGRDFKVDGELVPYGDLSALTGTLTGTLARGDSLNNVFYQGGYAGSVTGTITLVPAPTIPVPALGPAGLIGLAASLLGFGLVALAAGRRRR